MTIDPNSPQVQMMKLGFLQQLSLDLVKSAKAKKLLDGYVPSINRRVERRISLAKAITG